MDDDGTRDPGRGIGDFIRDLRRSAGVSLRQLAERAGVSNPYLSQIERGLRRPSAEVLAQIAHALRVSTPAMYLRAGLLDPREGSGVVAAIAADPDLTVSQKKTLTQIYETFRRENFRERGEPGEPGAVEPVGPAAGDDVPAGRHTPATGTSTPTADTGTPEPSRRSHDRA